MAEVSSLTIVLASTLPALFIVGLAVLLWRYSRRRSSALFNRGITPIDDEEIESWKTAEKLDEREESYRQESTCSWSPRHHAQNSSVSSTRKSSVIVYQNSNTSPYQSSFAGDQSPSRSFCNKYSIELPRSPILARAPNARPGLTDEAVQGDDAFIPQLKRQPSRLGKSQAGNVSRSLHSRHRSAYTELTRDRWYGQQPDVVPDLSSRQSSDGILPRWSTGQRGHERAYSATANRPRMSLDEGTGWSGLSPRPIRRSEIGRAIG